MSKNEALAASQRATQEMRNKATRAWNPRTAPSVKKLVAQAHAANYKTRDQKRAYMVSQGQMRGGFAAD